jgi:hypothetical protein
MDIDKTIERVLRATDDDELDPGSLGLEFEKGGDTSFDAVLRRLDEGTTSDHGRIRGLRMLARLTRHFCVRRRPEVIEISIGLMEHPNVRVRSAAVNTAVFGASGMKRLGAFPPGVATATVERVKEAVAKAMERGLTPEQAELAQRFIASSGDVRVVAEE